jgi:hypothetical protein
MLTAAARRLITNLACCRLDTQARLLTKDEVRAVLQEEVVAAQQEGSIAAPTVQVGPQPCCSAACRLCELQRWTSGVSSPCCKAAFLKYLP